MQKDINVFCELYLFNNRVPVIMNYIDEKYYQIFELDIQFSKYRVRINNFGNEVLIYKRVINKIGENVLKFDHQLSIDNNTKSSMQKVYESINKYMKTKNSKFIIDLEAGTIAKSMNILWSIRKGMKINE